MASQRIAFTVSQGCKLSRNKHLDLFSCSPAPAAAAAAATTSSWRVATSTSAAAVYQQRRWKASQAVPAAQEADNVSGSGGVGGGGPSVNRRIDPLDMTFLNHGAAFKSKSTLEVLRGCIVYQLCSIGFLVENNEKLMKLGKTILGERLFAKLMKMTFYGHFVAGENRQAIKPVIHQMHSFGVKSILDYSVEEDISEEQAKSREMDACNVPQPAAAAAGTNEAEAHVAGQQGHLHHRPPPHAIMPGTSPPATYVLRSPLTYSIVLTKATNVKKFKAHENFGDRRKLVSSARTYFYQNEAQCEKNMETFLRCIEAVADSTGSTGMAAIKVTALGRPNLLLQLSEVIVRSHKYFQEVTGKTGSVQEQGIGYDAFAKRFKEDQKIKANPEVEEWLSRMTHDKKGLIHLFSWSGLIDTKLLLKDVFQVPSLKTGQMQPLIRALTSREEEQFHNMLKRMHTIFTAAREMDVRVMVDAEQSYFQPAIHRLAMEMMKKYNTEKAIVFNTYQCYLKNAYKNLTMDLEQAARQDFFFGAKLVRGAYMEQERERAANLGYEDPINPNYEATSEMYHNCLSECMRRMSELKKLGDGREKRIGIMVASHNADTIRFAIERMKELDIKGDERLICFGQLLGMCDNLTFPLGQAGYSVYKYVPYGPVNEVLPYLSRRARENKGILQKLEVEKTLLRRELTDRIKKGRFIYRPKGEYLPVGFDKLPVLQA